MCVDIVFQDEMYSLFFVNNNWYLFLRLHQLLCERLEVIAQQARRIASDECRYKKERKESTAIALRLKAPSKSWFYLNQLCNFISVVSRLYSRKQYSGNSR